MKLLMLIVDDEKKEQLEVVLNRVGVIGYTELPRATGVGTTGPRLGSRAFPRTSAVIFTVLAEETLEQVVGEIKGFCRDCGERLKMVVWGVEEVL
jgi:hypothetical protein